MLLMWVVIGDLLEYSNVRWARIVDVGGVAAARRRHWGRGLPPPSADVVISSTVIYRVVYV